MSNTEQTTNKPPRMRGPMGEVHTEDMAQQKKQKV